MEIPLRPPAEWFENPRLSGPHALEITSEGRIFGHIALFDSCHTADPHGTGVCVQPPRSRSGYSYFHLGCIETAEGGKVDVGQITLDTGHASLRADRRQAIKHYDNTGIAAADVRAGDDAYGIWVAGAVRPTVPEEKIRALSGAKVSGDWRNVAGRLELIGMLAVNIPGYLVPRVSARVAAGAIEDEDERLALVAAGIVPDLLPPEVVSQRTRLLAARARGGVSALAEIARQA